MIRILKIHGGTAPARRARLSRVQAWMEAAGWRLGDYAEEAGSAMFERQEGAPPLSLTDATRWMPGPRALEPREWLHTARADPRLVGLPAAVLLVLVIALLSLIAPPSFLDEEALKHQSGEEWRVVDTNQLNVREAPTTTAQQVGVLYRNQRVLIEGVVDNGWVRISVPARGYVAARYLKELNEQERSSQNGGATPKPGPMKSDPIPSATVSKTAQKSVQAPQPAAKVTEPDSKTLAPASSPSAARKIEPPVSKAQPASQKPPYAPGGGSQPPPLPPAAPAFPAPPSTLPVAPPALPPPPPASR